MREGCREVEFEGDNNVETLLQGHKWVRATDASERLTGL